MRILVIGDSCTDVFVYGVCKRLCPEAPVPVFNPISVVKNSGMSGNVAANLRSLGADVDLVTNSEIILKTRYVEEKSNHMLIRVDENDTISNSFSLDGINFSNYHAVVISDYDKGYLTKDDISVVCKSHSIVFLDTKKIIGDFADDAFFIKMNHVEKEKCGAAGVDMSRISKKLIVTVSEKGCEYDGVSYPAQRVDFRDVSGAGDTFLAALVFYFVSSGDIKKAIIAANKCASTVVQERGVTVI